MSNFAVLAHCNLKNSLGTGTRRGRPNVERLVPTHVKLCYAYPKLSTLNALRRAKGRILNAEGDSAIEMRNLPSFGCSEPYRNVQGT
jgi:hypothetical protein